GWWYWHHVSGLVFGALVLTWTFSGLLTMSPWGLLGFTGARSHVAAVRGTPTWGELEEFLEAAPAKLESGALRQVTTAPFAGQLRMVAVDSGGEQLRLDASASRAPLGADELDRAVAALGVPVRESALLASEDSFYYGHKREVELPVYRIVLDDAEQTRLYVSPTTGRVSGVDATGRLSRWIRVGLHDFDFAGLRERPIWDVVVLTLLAGVTAVCITGTWMAWRRVRLDVRRLLRKWRRRRAVAASARPGGLVGDAST